MFLAPVVDVGSVVLCEEGSWEEEEWLIGVARTLGTASFADGAPTLDGTRRAVCERLAWSSNEVHVHTFNTIAVEIRSMSQDPPPNYKLPELVPRDFFLDTCSHEADELLVNIHVFAWYSILRF